MYSLQTIFRVHCFTVDENICITQRALMYLKNLQAGVNIYSVYCVPPYGKSQTTLFVSGLWVSGGTLASWIRAIQTDL